MLNKLTSFIRQREMIAPGDRVVCAVSGGADSVALLFALYLLKEKLEIDLAAAHFNHRLRGEESDRDEAFVRDLCHRYDIPLAVGSAQVTAGEKGLEAAARDARYAFLRSLEGKIATAHTADDNAETVLMHLVRGTGLKGLGGITPISGNVIRPMLSVTRNDVEAFLSEYYVNHIEDGSNATDAFLRNRIRHRVMPLLTAENPRLAENLSAMALRLRLDEDCLSRQAEFDALPSVQTLRKLHPAVRSRMLDAFLKGSGIREPEETHLAMAEALVFSEKPSARASFPGGITVARCYDRLEVLRPQIPPEEIPLPCPGQVEIAGYRIKCMPSDGVCHGPNAFDVRPQGQLRVGPRRTGDSIRLSGGTKSLKKLFIDRKIPAAARQLVPVIRDTQGVIAACGIGVHLDRLSRELPAVTIQIEKTE